MLAANRTDASAAEELRRVLSEASFKTGPVGGRNQEYEDQILRDNAVRLVETLRLAEPFFTSTRPRVLECGAGPLYAIDALRWRYGGTIDLYAIEHPAAVRESLESELDKRGVSFAPHDLLSRVRPWPGIQFDLIILAEVIEHIPPTDLPELLRGLAACLSPSGGLLMSSPNPQAIWNILSLAFGNGEMLDPALPPEHGSYGHIRMYARGEVEQLLEYSGLTMHEWTLINWMHAHPWPGAPVRDRVRLGIQRVVPRIVPRWASGWICTATPLRSETEPRQ
jgi:hypothetical protein